MLVYIIIIASFIGIDQILKILAIQNLSGTQTVEFLPPILNFTYVENYGAAFGILQNKTIFLVLITGIVLTGLLLLIFSKKIQSRFLLFSLSLIVSGGFGNLIDRVARGYVVDYIHFTLFDFPVFNFADCCVVIGTFLMILYIFFFESHVEKEKD